MKILFFVLLATLAFSMPRDVDEANNFVEFMKGFLEGINEKGDFEKLMKCIKDGEHIVVKIIDAIKKIKTLNPIKVMEGVKELIEAVKELMAMLKPCTEGFEVLKKLINAIAHVNIANLVKHILAHPGEFIKLITQAIESFVKKDWHGTGKAIGGLLYLLFLKAQLKAGEPLVEFMKGFLQGINEKGSIEKLMKCIKGGEEIITKIIDAVKLIKTMNPIKVAEGVKKLVEAIQQLMTMLKPCMDGFEQLKKLVQALSHIKIPDIVKRIISHPGEVVKHITEAIEGFTKKDFHKCGLGIGGLLYVLLLSRETVAEPFKDFITGLLVGIAEPSKPEELEKCFKNGEALINKTAAALTLMAKFDPKGLMDGYRQIHDVMKELHSMLQSCMHKFEVLKKLFQAVAKARPPEVIKKILAGKEEYKKLIDAALASFKSGNITAFGIGFGKFMKQLFLTSQLEEPFSDFLKAFLETIGEKGKPEDLEKCITKEVPLYMNATAKALSHMQKMDPKRVLEGIAAIHKVTAEFHKVLKPCMKGFDTLKKLFDTVAKSKPSELVKKILAAKDEYKKLIDAAIASFKKGDMGEYGTNFGMFMKQLFP